eukprot:m.46011 g.46011  ORF g.46011 m.46011 type:complete len:226 (+) comp33657_c0_seq3:73-750(+)
MGDGQVQRALEAKANEPFSSLNIGKRMNAALLISSKWTFIAQRLGPRPYRMVEIESMKKTGDEPQENATTMLEKWTGEHGVRATNRLLIKAMLEEKMLSSAEEIFGEDLVEFVPKNSIKCFPFTADQPFSSVEIGKKMDAALLIAPKWKFIAQRLKPRPYRIVELKNMDKPDRETRENTTRMLERWTAEHGCKATNRLLIEAMLEEHMKDSAAKIFGEKLVEELA